MKATIKTILCMLFVASSAISFAQSSGEINGHEYVDLGLSVKWATCNIGADTPSAYGDHFAWGETTPKSKYLKEKSETYNINVGGDIAGNAQYDAARANWGGTWRLPTEAEFEELVKNCKWTWTTQGGHNGYKVTSKKNGKSIFLPAAGGYASEESNGLAGYWGSYWSATTDRDAPIISCILYIYEDEYFIDWNTRSCCLSIRPVSK